MGGLLIAGVAAMLAAAAPAETVEDLGWLSGTWLSQEGGKWTEERWSAPRGDTMLGTVLSGTGGAASGFEFMRIARGPDGALVFWASPEGRTAVPFRYEGGGEREARFVNRDNDYPNRIVYRRSGDGLTGTISALDGSNAKSWTYRRQRR